MILCIFMGLNLLTTVSAEEKDIVEVFFHGNGGKLIEDDKETELVVMTVEKGSTVEDPGIPVKDGSVFAGWYLEDTFETKVEDISSYVIEDTTDFYAKFIAYEDLYSVTLITGGNISYTDITGSHEESDTAKVYVEKGSALSLVTIGSPNGKTLYGWYSDEAFNTLVTNSLDGYVPEEDITLYARFVNTYTVTLQNSKGGTFLVDGNKDSISLEIFEGEEIQSAYSFMEMNPNQGYEFIGWYGDAGLENLITLDIDTYVPEKDMTLYAGWKMSETGTWKSNSKGWWYEYADGTYPVNTWKEIDGKNYHFNKYGYMQTGWLDDSGKWYYLNQSGQMTTGWQKVNHTWYYMNQDGVMQTGWIKPGNTWYYLKSSGAMATGWQKIKNVWYYLNESGAMATGWKKVNNKWYYLKPSGAMATGWQKVNDVWYYLNESGSMAVGWRKVNNVWYYFRTSGAMVTGWQKINDTWYYFNPSGSMAIGWKKINDVWYYLKSSGAMATGVQSIGGKTYYFDKSGAMLTGSKEIDNTVYILDETNGNVIASVLIANKKHYIGTYVPSDLISVGNGVSMVREAANAYLQLQNAMSNAGYSISPCSGYRSYWTQKDLWARYASEDGASFADTYSSRGGYSDHQTGYAIDVYFNNGLSKGACRNLYLYSNSDGPACWQEAPVKKLHSILADYGFIVRYPEGKQSITGYQPEYWHLRYVGTYLAKKVYDSGLSLEEYLGVAGGDYR